jgi:NADH dehydrogenase/NADH:ubiquinone oxidoreductase subunit G
MPAKFQMVNDFTGETRDATLGDEESLRADGFRVLAGGPYDAAIAERRQAEADALAKAQGQQNPSVVELQTRSDAALTAQRTYPDADGGPDKLSKKEQVEPTDEGGDVSQAEVTAMTTQAQARAVANEEAAKAAAERQEAAVANRRGNRK